METTEVAKQEDVQTKVVAWEDIVRKEGFYITYVVPGSLAQTGSYYGPFFIAYHPCELVAISESHVVPGDPGLELRVYKLTGTQTWGGDGDPVLVENWDMNRTGNSVLTKSGTDFISSLDTVSTDGLRRTVLAPGDRLSLDIGGVSPNNIRHVTVTAYFKNLGRGHYLT